MSGGPPVSDRFTTGLWNAAEPALSGQRRHPVVRGLVDGTLPDAEFARFIVQDCLFIADYARSLSLAAARAPRTDVGGCFGEMAVRLTQTELGLNLDLARELGVSEEELDAARPVPVTRAYGDFLLRAAALEDFAEVVAAFLPCFWGYSVLGRGLLDEPPSPNPRYARWIAAYGGDSFAATATWCRDLVDELAAGVNEATRTRMTHAFVTSSQLEYAFWNVALGDGGHRLWNAGDATIDKEPRIV